MFTNRLTGLKSGSNIEFDGPFGFFVIQEKQPDSTYLFVATGTGIAPFLSLIKSHKKLSYKLLHRIRFENGMYEKNDYGKQSVEIYNLFSILKT
ncbi:hypothetical protein ACFLSA_04840 [Bacteroidota bacterium]